jgi:hypothetical protein
MRSRRSLYDPLDVQAPSACKPVAFVMSPSDSAVVSVDPLGVVIGSLAAAAALATFRSADQHRLRQ